MDEFFTKIRMMPVGDAQKSALELYAFAENRDKSERIDALSIVLSTYHDVSDVYFERFLEFLESDEQDYRKLIPLLKASRYKKVRDEYITERLNLQTGSPQYLLYSPDVKLQQKLDSIPGIFSYFMRVGLDLPQLDLYRRLFRRRGDLTFPDAVDKYYREHIPLWFANRTTVDFAYKSVLLLIDECIRFRENRDLAIGILENLFRNVDYIPDGVLSPLEKVRHRCYAAKLLLREEHRVYRQEIQEWLIEFTGDETKHYDHRSETLDVLMSLPNPPAEAEQLYRQLGMVVDRRAAFNDAGRQLGGGRRDIAHDAQNVHHSNINKETHKTIITLLKDPEIRGNTIYKVIEKIEKEYDQNYTMRYSREAIDTALKRISKDPATFTNKKVTLGGVLVMVWNRIERLENSESREGIIERLLEELEDMHSWCATGHLARLVAVLVGYFDDIKQAQNFLDQLHMNSVARLNSILREDEELMDLMLDAPDQFNEKMREILNEKFVDELREEFVDGDYISKEDFDAFVLTFTYIKL